MAKEEVILLGLSSDKKYTINIDRVTHYLFWLMFAIIMSSIANFKSSTIGLYLSQLISIVVTFMLTQTALTTGEKMFFVQDNDL